MPTEPSRRPEGRSLWGPLEPAAWCALALVAAVVQLPYQQLRPRFSSDSFQYLSAAHHLRSTQRMATSLVHFDTERSHGAIPAPLTWFPPGYPAAIAALSAAGLSYEAASLWISIVCFATVTVGIWRLVRMLDPSPWTARGAVVCWLANSHALTFSVSALSESMFTAFGLASLLFLMHAGEQGTSTRTTACWAGAAAMAGASYWVRYAGVLWVGTCAALLLVRLAVARNTRSAQASLRSAIVAGGLLLLFVMPLMVRNIVLVGDWRGGNNTPATMPLHGFLSGTPRILYHLIIGDGPASQVWFPVALMAIGLIGLGATALRADGNTTKLILPLREILSRNSPLTKRGIVLAALAIYGAGIAAIALRSVISYGPRMYLPVLPHLIALAGCGIAHLLRRQAVGGYWRAAGVALVLCSLSGYVTGNVISRISLGPDWYQRTAIALAGPDESGRGFEQLLKQVLKPGEVIAATNGQAAGYILNRPTLSLAGRPYTLLTWSARELATQLARYRAAHLLVFRNAQLDPVVDQSPFLHALAAGQSPQWLPVVGANQDVYVYRVELGAADTSSRVRR